MSAGSWTRVADEAGFGTVRAFRVGAERIAVFHTPEGWFALDDTCSHDEASLADGEIEEGCVTCPLHGSRFSLATGAVDGLPATEPVRTWAVKVEEGSVYIGASSPGKAT